MYNSHSVVYSYMLRSGFRKTRGFFGKKLHSLDFIEFWALFGFLDFLFERAVGELVGS